jgi:Amt family ammonium transporter
MHATHGLLDVSWLIVCTALVLLMQAGFTCLESGLVRSKSSINVAIKNFADFCLTAAIFWFIGVPLMFGTTYGGLIGTTVFSFEGRAHPWLMALLIFQILFCGTATTIVSGAVAERMRFWAYLAVTTVLASIIYPVTGHWIWGGIESGIPSGWLAARGFVDFAGATVVHSVGGWLALASIIIIGPRIGRFGEDRSVIRPNSIPIATLGVFLLWFGWLGFNGGSLGGVTKELPNVVLATIIAGACGGITALVLSWARSGWPCPINTTNGSLAGLVAITASANITSPASAAIIGSVGGVVCFIGINLLERFELDDAVGAIPVHLGGGVWGTLAVAVFGDSVLSGTGLGLWDQLLVQVQGVAATGAWAFGLGFCLLWLINRLSPLRVSPDDERIGLNISEHGESSETPDLLDEMDRHRAS